MKNLIASAIALNIASTAAAAENVTVTGSTATVSTAAVDLNSPEGIVLLKSRIKAAATEICLENVVEPVRLRMARAKCISSAVSSGNLQLDRMVAAEGLRSRTTASAVLTGTKR